MYLSDELSQFRDSVARLATRAVTPLAAEVDCTDQLPRSLVEVMADAGLVQLAIPEEYGGPGGSLQAICIAREAIGAAGSMALAQLAGQSGIIAYPILHFGTKEQRRHFLPQLAHGALTCICLSEANAGSDPTAMTTRGRRDGSGWVINGQKSWISYGVEAALALVFARTSGTTGSRGISAFIVDTKTAGFVETRHNNKLGGRGIPNVELLLDDVRVPQECLLGDEGEGFRSAMRALHLMRPPIGAAALGLAQAAYDYARTYAGQRLQGSRRLTDHQGVRWMLADMATQIEAARCLLYECARQADSGYPLDHYAALSSMAKWKTTEVAQRVCTDAVQILGAAGYMTDHPVERYYRDAKLATIYEGTSQIQLNTIAARLIR